MQLLSVRRVHDEKAIRVRFYRWLQLKPQNNLLCHSFLYRQYRGGKNTGSRSLTLAFPAATLLMLQSFHTIWIGKGPIMQAILWF